jgi:hypothetical protein
MFTLFLEVYDVLKTLDVFDGSSQNLKEIKNRFGKIWVKIVIFIWPLVIGNIFGKN